MSDLLTPNDLPGGSGANFIAYGSQERVADPQSGEAITVRPQVYVKYYPQIKVKELQEGGRSGDKADLVTVHFDPTSVSIGDGRTLKEEIRAHMDADDPTIPTLRQALENDTAVGIGIETQRKAKNADTKAAISPLTHIHALRGAQEPDGTKATTNDSFANTSNRLALVNGQGTKHILSNPWEWKSLVSNKAGDLPPDGWRNFAPGENWAEFGAAIASDNAAPANAGSGGAGFDPSELLGSIEKIVNQSVNDALLQHGEGGHSGGGRPVTRGGRFREGPAYDPRTSLGYVSLGGYVPTAWHWAVRWAHVTLRGFLEEGAEVDQSQAWDVAEAMMIMADQVQVNAYLAISEEKHHQAIQVAVPDRTAASHRDAERWVQWVIDYVHPLSDASVITDEDYRSLVVENATENLAEAGRRAEAGFQEVAERTDNRRQSQPSQQQEPSAGGGSDKAVEAFVQTVQRSWKNPEALVNLGLTGNEKGYGDTRVNISEVENGVEITLADGEGVSLMEAMRNRHTELTKDADDGPAPAEQGTQQETQQNAPAEQQKGGEKSQEQRATDGAHAAVKAADLAGLKKIFQYAQQQNLLSVKVWVKPVGESGVEVGESADGGFSARPLSDVINRRKRALEGAPQGDEQKQQEPAEPEASAETPAAEATDSAEPEQDENFVPDPDQGGSDESSSEPEGEPESNDDGQEASSEGTSEPEPETPAEESAPEGDGEGEASTEEPSEEPVSAEPEQEKPAEEGGNEAQQIADEATNAGYDVDTIQGLLDTVRERDMTKEKVTAKGRQGGLEAYLKTLLKTAQRKADSDS